MSAEALRIERFRPEDQGPVKALILTGLAERWGTVDPSLNPDLDDIAGTYTDGVVLVAWAGNEVVGTGILVPRADGEREVVRLSVAASQRRRGIGRLVLDGLVTNAEREGARRIVLETTANWHEAIALYTGFGFQFSHEAEGAFGADAYFFLDLPHRRVASSDPG